MAYEVAIEQFQGPFDVLLQLIEAEELNITDISLAQITEAYMSHLQAIEERFPEELADFLVVAAQLIYLKSRALLPYLEVEDEGSAAQLTAHLKMYKEFRDAADVLTERMMQGQFAMPRVVSIERLTIVEFAPPTGVTVDHLRALYEQVLTRLAPVIRLPKAAIRKAITLKEKITALYDILKHHEQVHFNELIAVQQDRMDVVMTFLAVLELVKQNSIRVNQANYYGDITITRLSLPNL
jgi:segregation and condensation protein A